MVVCLRGERPYYPGRYLWMAHGSGANGRSIAKGPEPYEVIRDQGTEQTVWNGPVTMCLSTGQHSGGHVLLIAVYEDANNWVVLGVLSNHPEVTVVQESIREVVMNRHEEHLQATAEDLLSRDLSDVFATGPDADVTLPGPDADVMVSTSVKLPFDLHQRIKKLAERQGVGVSTLLREWAKVGLH